MTVDEQPPDLPERNDPDQVLDVHAAIAKRTARPVGLGDLSGEGDYALEARLNFGGGGHLMRLLAGAVADGEPKRLARAPRRKPCRSWRLQTFGGGRPRSLAYLPGTPRSLRPRPPRFSLANSRPRLRREALASPAMRDLVTRPALELADL